MLTRLHTALIAFSAVIAAPACERGREVEPNSDGVPGNVHTLDFSSSSGGGAAVGGVTNLVFTLDTRALRRVALSGSPHQPVDSVVLTNDYVTCNSLPEAVGAKWFLDRGVASAVESLDVELRGAAGSRPGSVCFAYRDAAGWHFRPEKVPLRWDDASKIWRAHVPVNVEASDAVEVVFHQTTQQGPLVKLNYTLSRPQF